MINLTICDDDINTANYISCLTKNYSIANSHDIDCHVFNNPFDLINLIEKNRLFDIYILDIIMPGMTGVRLAEEIRIKDPHGIIIFLTNSDEFCKEAFSVEAIQYLIKPVDTKKYAATLARALLYLNNCKAKTFPVQTKNGIRQVAEDNIVYIESFGHKLIFHMNDGEVFNTINSSLTLTKLSEALSFPPFFSPYRGFLVNYNYVDCVNKSNIFMITGDEIPIPLKQSGKVRQQYSEYLLTKYNKKIPNADSG